jgi:hypothetical protein
MRVRSLVVPSAIGERDPRPRGTRAQAGGKRAPQAPYALRHTFASFAIAAGVPLFELSRFMGTSVEQIGRTYGHLLPDSLERARTALDGFLATEQKPQEAFRDGLRTRNPSRVRDLEDEILANAGLSFSRGAEI